MSNCKACGVRIRWLRTQAGRRLPLNFEPSPIGIVTVDEVGDAVVWGTVDKVPAGSEAYVPHFATCTKWGKNDND